MDLKIEQKYFQKGHDFVIGIDEAGRGPLAGPVVAAAIALRRLRQNFQFLRPKQTGLSPKDELFSKELFKLKDSKKLTLKKRDFFFKLLREDKNLKWGVGIVSEKAIDKKNILKATLTAMEKALKELMKNCQEIKPKNSIILIDGRDILKNIGFRQKAVIKGDDKIWSIAAASIIAKVSRDKLMKKYHKKYPQYDFSKNKGYGTKKHIEAIKKYGPCPIHRLTFEPIKTYNFLFPP